MNGGKSWEMKSAVRVLAGEKSLGIAVNRLQG